MEATAISELYALKNLDSDSEQDEGLIGEDFDFDEAEFDKIMKEMEDEDFEEDDVFDDEAYDDDEDDF